MVEYEVDGAHILYVQVPSTLAYADGERILIGTTTVTETSPTMRLCVPTVCEKAGQLLCQQGVPVFSVKDLRHDLIDRARLMTRARTQSHPGCRWMTSTAEECSLADGYRNRKEGITLASILLFGPDTMIMSALSHHKSDAIFRVFNLDRYDDRDVITTNLLESYDRLMAFGQKHLNDIFVMEGVQSISARDKILREVISNSLAHRDYSSPYVAKLVIEKDRFFTKTAIERRVGACSMPSSRWQESTDPKSVS